MWVLRNTNTSKEREQLTTLKSRQEYMSIQTLAPSCSAPDKYSGKDSFAQDERSFSWTLQVFFTCRDFGFRKNSAGLPFHGNAKHYPSDCIICFRSSGFWYGLVRFCCSQISSLSNTWRVICVQYNIELCSAVLVFPAAASMIVNLQLVLVSRLCSAVWLCLAFIKGHSLRVEPQEAMHNQHIATWAT